MLSVFAMNRAPATGVCKLPVLQALVMTSVAGVTVCVCAGVCVCVRAHTRPRWVTCTVLWGRCGCDVGEGGRNGLLKVCCPP